MVVGDELQQEVAAIGDLSRVELAARWKLIYRTEPPKGARRPLLERAIAWDIQAKVFGGLSPSAKRTLEQAVRNERQNIAHGAGLASSSTQNGADRRRLPSPGMRLVREWGGKTHIVEVTDGGYLWEGAIHRSLAAIARTITGARWSGPRFFGL
jgi:hypothetical protein